MILFIFQLAEREHKWFFKHISTYWKMSICWYLENVIKIRYRNNIYITPPSTNRMVKVEWEAIQKNNYYISRLSSSSKYQKNERKKENEMRRPIISLIYFNKQNNPIRNKRIEPMKKTIMFIFYFLFFALLSSSYIFRDNTRTIP